MILRPPNSELSCSTVCGDFVNCRSRREACGWTAKRRGRTAPPCLYRSAVSIALTLELLGGVGPPTIEALFPVHCKLPSLVLFSTVVTSALFSTWMLPLATSLVTEVTPVLLVTWILPFVVSPEIVVVALLLWTRMLPPTVSLPQLGPPMAIATALPCTWRLPFTLVLDT